MLDAAIEAGELDPLVREAADALEDERLWQLWVTGVSPLGFEEWKGELAERARIQRVIAATSTDDVIADSLAISGAMLNREEVQQA